MLRLAITGTDTGVGKTMVGSAIAAAFVNRGKRVGVMKPVETGVTADSPSRDSVRLKLASVSPDALDVICPYMLPKPVAPLAAARDAGVTIDLGVLDGALARINEGRDVVIVEGAGGLLVPVTPALRFSGLCMRWTLDVVVVAANRLGVLNHVLLTVQAATTAQLRVRAVVLNEIAASPPDQSTAGNQSLLEEQLPHIPVVGFPWMPQPDDYSTLAIAAEPVVNILLEP